MASKLNKTLSVVLIAVYLATLILPVSASAAPVAGNVQPAAGKPEPQRGVNPETGRVAFIGGGEPIREEGFSGVQGLDPKDRAQGIANAYGKEFGLKNPAQELKLLKADKDNNGKDIVRYQQMHQGVPVMAGELIVNMDADGNLLSMSGEVSPDLTLDTRPAIKANAARSLWATSTSSRPLVSIRLGLRKTERLTIGEMASMVGV